MFHAQMPILNTPAQQPPDLTTLRKRRNRVPRETLRKNRSLPKGFHVELVGYSCGFEQIGAGTIY